MEFYGMIHWELILITKLSTKNKTLHSILAMLRHYGQIVTCKIFFLLISLRIYNNSQYWSLKSTTIQDFSTEKGQFCGHLQNLSPKISATHLPILYPVPMNGYYSFKISGNRKIVKIELWNTLKIIRPLIIQVEYLLHLSNRINNGILVMLGLR